MRRFDRRADIETAVERIASDRRRGASALADAALALLLKTNPARVGGPPRAWHGDVVRLAGRLAKLRPSMPAIENALRRALSGFAAEARLAGTAGEAHRCLRVRARAERRALRAARAASAAAYAGAFSHFRAPMTYSASANVAAAFAALECPPASVTVCESRPLLEGRSLARRLSAQPGAAGRVQVITDAQAGLALARCDAFVVGCDAVFSDGSVANKAGTALIAGAAKRQGVPVVVVADTYRLSARSRFHSETQPPEDVWRDPPRGVRVHNTAFEVVPPALIHRVVIERRVLRTGEVRRHWKRRHLRGEGS